MQSLIFASKIKENMASSQVSSSVQHVELKLEENKQQPPQVVSPSIIPNKAQMQSIVEKVYTKFHDKYFEPSYLCDSARSKMIYIYNGYLNLSSLIWDDKKSGPVDQFIKELLLKDIPDDFHYLVLDSFNKMFKEYAHSKKYEFMLNLLNLRCPRIGFPLEFLMHSDKKFISCFESVEGVPRLIKTFDVDRDFENGTVIPCHSNDDLRRMNDVRNW